MRLKGKIAVITGASSGIGRATAILFAREGAQVICVDVDEKGGKETLDMINNESLVVDGGRTVITQGTF